MLTDDEIKALLEGCPGVTQGPWQRQYMPTKFTNYVRSNAAFVADSIGENLDAAHIARCDPGTIAELCTRLLAAEERVKELEQSLDERWEDAGRRRYTDSKALQEPSK